MASDWRGLDILGLRLGDFYISFSPVVISYRNGLFCRASNGSHIVRQFFFWNFHSVCGGLKKKKKYRVSTFPSACKQAIDNGHLVYPQLCRELLDRMAHIWLKDAYGSSSFASCGRPECDLPSKLKPLVLRPLEVTGANATCTFALDRSNFLPVSAEPFPLEKTVLGYASFQAQWLNAPNHCF